MTGLISICNLSPWKDLSQYKVDKEHCPKKLHRLNYAHHIINGPGAAYNTDKEGDRGDIYLKPTDLEYFFSDQS